MVGIGTYNRPLRLDPGMGTRMRFRFLSPLHFTHPHFSLCFLLGRYNNYEPPVPSFHSTNLGVMNRDFKAREDFRNDKSLAKLGDFRNTLHDTDEKLLERLKLWTDEISSVIHTCEQTVRSDTVP